MDFVPKGSPDVIDKKTVAHVANLAKLQLSDAELDLFSQQLSAILDHIGELEKIDTQGIEPLVTPSPIEIVLRPDFVLENNTLEDILKNAPQTSGNLFCVPPVV